MIQRITAALIAAAVLVGGVATVATSASAGNDTTAVESAKKKKKKKKKKAPAPAPKPTLITVGTYSGQTSNGIPMSLTLNADRASGTMTYCGMTAPLSVSGAGFQVIYIDPITSDTINAAGFFNINTKQATGTVGDNGCDSTTQTFTLQAP